MLPDSITKPYTILVADDEPTMGPLAADVLEPAGYVVLHTTDPREAIRLARQRPADIDLLLVDVKMPLMGGIELARRILVLRPKMKVILMSGNKITGVNETDWSFLEKPFGIDTLTQMVASALGGPSPDLKHLMR
jgi:two-component system, cell cycle sensor histidine kinase and response regulator CckA